MVVGVAVKGLTLTPAEHVRLIRGEASHGEEKRGNDAKPRQKWDYETRLAQQLEAAGITGFYVDAEYLPERRLRGDIVFATPRYLVVEVQGAVHRIKAKWHADILKAQDTMLGGWRLLPIATSQVRSGEAVDIIRRALAK